MKELNPLEKEKTRRLLERYIEKQKSLNRDEKIKQMVGENPTDENIRLAEKHIDDTEAFFKAGGKLEMRPSRQELDDFIVTPEQWKEALRFYHEHKNDLIQAAIFNRRNAVSHRPKPFKVGCAASGIGPGMKNGEYVVWQGYNFKPHTGHVKGEDKRCAERNVLEGAQSDVKTVFAIATVSKETSTGDPTKGHDVLHPCKDCRMMYRDLLKQGFLREDTMILNANDSREEIITEERTLKELLDLYKDDES